MLLNLKQTFWTILDDANGNVSMSEKKKLQFQEMLACIKSGGSMDIKGEKNKEVCIISCVVINIFRI